MLKQFSIALFISCFTLPVVGQYKSLTECIPAHFGILDSSSGDIDLDGMIDMVLVLRNDQEQQKSESNRPLLLLKGNASGQYELVARNDSVVLCLGCGGIHGDPFSAIIIKEGTFSIQHFGGSSWRWSRTITFVYNEKSKQYVLHRDIGESWNVSDANKITETKFNEPDYGTLQFDRFSNSLNR